jgi:hypothetical protein
MYTRQRQGLYIEQSDMKLGIKMSSIKWVHHLLRGYRAIDLILERKTQIPRSHQSGWFAPLLSHTGVGVTALGSVALWPSERKDLVGM